MSGPWGREVGADRDREGFPSWNPVSRWFRCSRAAPRASARENSLDLVFLRCHGVLGVAEVPHGVGCGRAGGQQRVQAGSCGGWARCHLGGLGTC